MHKIHSQESRMVLFQRSNLKDKFLICFKNPLLRPIARQLGNQEDKINDKTDDKIIDLEVDRITWKLIISVCLKKLYGLLGEASHFDVLMSTKLKLLIRVYSQDQEMFQNSFLSFTFKLSDYLGRSDLDMICYIKVIKRANFLGLVIDDDYYDH
ncbi:LOW QUALITY PROTEIN: uncharacterized protein PRCAT00001176001 [Priceomyces carsonii]|uniref:uncharacterized protein n=1 Tax=Priceomyces carsonii TaxID=28549 RepID=UPI002EDAEA58|nr:unnamed protein product [Priceomyces carsonii]